MHILNTVYMSCQSFTCLPKILLTLKRFESNSLIWDILPACPYSVVFFQLFVGVFKLVPYKLFCTPLLILVECHSSNGDDCFKLLYSLSIFKFLFIKFPWWGFQVIVFLGSFIFLLVSEVIIIGFDNLVLYANIRYLYVMVTA